MAAIKIQSLKDVARAYFQTFGYSADNITERDLDVFLGMTPLQTDSASEWVKRADLIFFRYAQQIFGDIFEQQQLTAYFKLIFTLNQGSTQCSIQGLIKGEIPAALLNKMRQSRFLNAPQYHFEQMKPQVIDEPHWLSRMFSCFKKGQKE